MNCTTKSKRTTRAFAALLCGSLTECFVSIFRDTDGAQDTALHGGTADGIWLHSERARERRTLAGLKKTELTLYYDDGN